MKIKNRSDSFTKVKKNFQNQICVIAIFSSLILYVQEIVTHFMWQVQGIRYNIP